MATSLEQSGWRVLARNWRGGGGELDLVVSRQGALRFVEVKARKVGFDAGPEAITYPKRRALIRAGEAWLASHHEPAGEVCFLLALVDCSLEPPSIEWVDNPFDAG